MKQHTINGKLTVGENFKVGDILCYNPLPSPKEIFLRGKISCYSCNIWMTSVEYSKESILMIFVNITYITQNLATVVLLPMSVCV